MGQTERRGPAVYPSLSPGPRRETTEHQGQLSCDVLVSSCARSILHLADPASRRLATGLVITPRFCSIVELGHTRCARMSGWANALRRGHPATCRPGARSHLRPLHRSRAITFWRDCSATVPASPRPKRRRVWARPGRTPCVAHGARPLAVMARQLRNPLLILLVAAALTSFVVGERTSALIILLSVAWRSA